MITPYFEMVDPYPPMAEWEVEPNMVLKRSRSCRGSTAGILLSGSLLLLICFSLSLLTPSGGYSFTGEGCAEGECRDCHSLAKEEAAGFLKEWVDRVNRVDFSEVPGLFMVEVEKQGRKYPVYIDFSKSFLISGSVIRIKDREDITRRKLMEMNRVEVSKIPLEDALILGSAEAAKKVIVFTDPQCPYCIRLHKEIKKVVQADPGIAFYIKLFPLVKLHPDSPRISQSIVCARSMEMLEDSFAGRPIPDPECQTRAVDENRVLARSLGINSTPTLILPDGLVVPGFKEAPSLLSLLGSKASAGN